MRYAARSGTRAPFPPDHIPLAFLQVIASITNPDRDGRSNPRQAKRSHRYPATPSDPARRAKPRGPLTLVMLPMPVPDDP